MRRTTRSLGSSTLVAGATLATWMAPARSAAAEDGVYGRFDGDAMAAVEVGGSFAIADAAARGPGLTGRLGFFFVQTLGVTVQYDDRLGSADAVARSLLGAVEIRPLFLSRFTQGLQRGPARLDLFIDSFGLALGAWTQWERAPDCADDCQAHGMELSLGAEVPFLPQVSSPYLAIRGGVRWALSDLEAGGSPPAVSGTLTLTLGYHHVFAIHLVDAGDRFED
jgi:hypothetical protein